MTRSPGPIPITTPVISVGIFENSGPISLKKSAPYSSVAISALRVSMPSPFSELVTTISG